MSNLKFLIVGLAVWAEYISAAVPQRRLSLPLKEVSIANDAPFVYKSYQDTVYCNASSPILFPKSVEELQEIVRNAYVSGETVKVLGGRNSITDVICTDGIPISTELMQGTHINDDGTVTIRSGTQLADAVEVLHSAGLSLEHIPTFGGITVGGATGTGAHGSSLKHPGALSDQIVSVTLIDGTGEIRTITEADGDDFRAVGVHLGLMGAIVNITMRTVPLFKMRVHNYPDSENILLDGTALKEAREYDTYQMWWFPHSRQVIVSKGNYSDDLSLEGDARINLIPAISSAQASASHVLFELMQSSKDRSWEYQMEEFSAMSLHRWKIGKPPIFWEYDQNGNQKFVNPAVGYAHRLLASRCSGSCAWENGINSVRPEESAMAFEINELPNVVRTIRTVLEHHPAAFPMIGIFIRFTKPSNNLMSIGSGRENVHMEWTSPMRRDSYTKSKSGIAAYQAILQAMVKEHNGRPHWGKNGAYFFSPSLLQSQAPNLELFSNITKKYDPNGIFLNRFGMRLLHQSEEINVDPGVAHCALQDYCMCSKDSDCASEQACIRTEGGYNVCQYTDEAHSSQPILPEISVDDLGALFSAS